MDANHYLMGMMMRSVLVFALTMLLTSAPVLAEKADVASEIVSCVNNANGNVEPVLAAPWKLTQAILELPYEHERTRLADGFFFIGGRKLGYHGTWAAFLDIAQNEWVAYETRHQTDELVFFAESFVPPEVIVALEACGVRWGGSWTADYPFIVLDPPAVTPLPEAQRLPEDFGESGADLLPPITDAN